MSEKEIVMFRVITGEDIIAEFHEETSDGGLVYKNPIQLGVFPSQTKPGEQSYGFVPFPPYKDPSKREDSYVKFNKNGIVFYPELDEHFLTEYKRIFSKIVTPTQSIILGR